MPEKPLERTAENYGDEDITPVPYTPETAAPSKELEIGRSGTYLAHGYLSLTDYNIELTGLHGLVIYDKMRKGDSTVRGSVKAVVLPILSAQWVVEDASDDEMDKEIGDFVRYQLLSGDGEIQWDDFQREALTLSLSYGRMVFEKVFQIVEWNGQQLIGWKKFAPRAPRSIMRWSVGDGDDEQFGITQQLTTGPTVSIPGDKLIVLSFEKEGDNHEGISLLRSAHKHWYMKDQLYRIDAIAHERQGMGIPYAKISEGYTPTPAEQSKVRVALQNLRSDSNSYVEIPVGYDIGWMDMHANTTRVPKDSIEHHDRQIMKNVLAQFLEIGGTGSHGNGGQSAGATQMDLFVLSLQAVAKWFGSAVQLQAIRQLVDLNWPGYGVYPKIKAEKVGPDSAAGLATTLQSLVTSRIITPTDDDEGFMRDLLGMPDLPEDMQDGVIDRSAPKPVAPGDPNAPAGPAEDTTGKQEGNGGGEDDPEDKTASEAMRAVKALAMEVRKAIHG